MISKRSARPTLGILSIRRATQPRSRDRPPGSERPSSAAHFARVLPRNAQQERGSFRQRGVILVRQWAFRRGFKQCYSHSEAILPNGIVFASGELADDPNRGFPGRADPWTFGGQGFKRLGTRGTVPAHCPRARRTAATNSAALAGSLMKFVQAATSGVMSWAAKLPVRTARRPAAGCGMPP